MAITTANSATGLRWTRRIFLASVSLAMAYDLIGVVSGVYLRPTVVSWLSSVMSPGTGQPAFLQNIDAESFYSNVIQPLIGFVIAPVIFLFVFYRFGSRLPIDPGSEYRALVKQSFFGGFVGYVLGYIMSVGVIWSSQGSAAFDSWYVEIPGLLISLMRDAVLMVLFAFTGVYLGYLRRRRNVDLGEQQPTQS